MLWTICLSLLLSMSTAIPSNGREKRAFSLFSVVSFPNLECQTNMANMKGICLTKEECSSQRGGSAQGNCASAFGVCCMTVITDGAVAHNMTYIQNTEFPATFGATAPVTAATRAFNIAGGSEIKQIRLDFDTTVLTQPTLANGGCANDVISVTGSARTNNLGFNTLCGTLTGQHIYIDSANSATGAVLNINTDASVFGRSWKILVRQIEAGSLTLAPLGCLQYFYGSPSGSVQSFNHVSAGTTLGQLTVNLQYSACIRQEKGFNCISWREALPEANPDKFTLLDAAGAQANSQAGHGDADNDGDISDQAGSCAKQAVTIPGAGNVGDVFCGGKLNPVTGQAVSGVVRSNMVPFELGVFSQASTALGGFDLVYSQESC